jgi:glycosyltransferase involved in cell wall biosynthesis
MNISWFATGIEPTPDNGLTSSRASVRFRCLIPAEGLRKLGHQVRIIQSDTVLPSDLSDDDFGDAVVFLKSFDIVDESYAERARRLGRLVVYDFCDFDILKPGMMTHRKAMTDLAHRHVAASDALAAMVAESLGIETPSVISDPYEGPPGAPRFSAKPDALALVWFGHINNLQELFDQLDALAKFGQDVPLTLAVVSQRIDGIDEAFEQANAKFTGALSMHFTPWSLDATWAALADCDLVIIPSIDNDIKKAKSPNRIVEALRNGRFVVANPVTAYKDYGDFIRIDADIISGLRWVMDNRDIIEARIQKGQEFINGRHSPEAIAADWLEILKPL